MSILVQRSLSYFAYQIYSLPRLDEVVQTALIESTFPDWSEILVSLFWLKLKDGPYRFTLPVRYIVFLVWVNLFWRLSLSYFACRNSSSLYVWLKLSDGPYRVTLPNIITTFLFLVENALPALAELFCLFELIVSLFGWNALTAITELLCRSEVQSPYCWSRLFWRLSLSYFAISNSHSPYFGWNCHTNCTNMLLLRHLRSP